MDGQLRPVRGVLPLAAEAKRKKKKAMFVPMENVAEAALVQGIEVYGAQTLRQVIDHLNTKKTKGLTLAQGSSRSNLLTPSPSPPTPAENPLLLWQHN